MLGGALLFGSVFRLQERLLLRNSLFLGLGIVILANSRPFEGVIAFCAAASIIIVGMKQWILNEGGKRLTWRFVLPLVTICLFLVVWILFYNYRLTGDVFKLPHNNWNPRSATHEIIRNYRGGSQRLPVVDKLRRLWYFFIGKILSPFILGLWPSLREKKVIFSLGVVVLEIAINITWSKSRAWPHYVAPISCLIFVVIIHGLRSLRSFRIKQTPWGHYFVILISAVYFINSALALGMRIYKGPRKDWAHARSAIIKCLENQGPKDLIMVRYDPRHNIHREWIYNSADIDNAEVIWARELSPRKNKKLFEYLRDRNVWLLLADMTPPRLLPYFHDDGEQSVDTQDCGGGT
jgi:hypothetical protein